MSYAVIEDNICIRYPANPLSENPFTSFTFDWPGGEINGVNYVSVANTTMPIHNQITENIIEDDPVNVEGIWTQQFSIVPATPEEISTRTANAKNSIKWKATSLLTESDWVEMPSVTAINNTPRLINADEFLTYRLALRSIAVDPPTDVDVWPIKPNENWS